MTALEHARAIAEQLVQESPNDAPRRAILGEILAALGQKEAAIAEGKRATELLPESEDAYDGPEITCRLAQIYALTGESDKAFRLLDHLLEVPTVSRSPCSNSIRHGSRCGKIRVSKR